MGQISLQIMTRELCHDLYKGWTNDASIYMDMKLFKPYTYNEDAVNRYFESKQDVSRVVFAIMLDAEVIGELQLKQIDRDRKECTPMLFLRTHAVSTFLKRWDFASSKKKEYFGTIGWNRRTSMLIKSCMCCNSQTPGRFRPGVLNHYISSSGTESRSSKPICSVWPPFMDAHCSFVIRMALGLEPWKGPTMPFSSISSTIRAARA